jgi:hypothetical protein
MITSSRILTLLVLTAGLLFPRHSLQAAAAEYPPQSNEPAGPQFTMTLSPVQAVVQAGSAVKAKVVTVNTSSYELYFEYPVGPDRTTSYVATVHDENGNTPPDTPGNRRFRANLVEGSFTFDRIKPGGVSTDVIDLGRLYDLSHPGTYTIQVQRSATISPVVVKSNSVTITVIPVDTPQTSPSSAQAPASQPPFSLSLWTSPRALTFPLQGVWFDVITKNVSDHKVFLRTETPEKQQAGSVYKVDVKDSNGASPTKKESGRLSKIDDNAPLSSALTSTPRQAGESLCLHPGEDWRDTIQLKDFYDINTAGQYTIQVRRWDDETKTWVKSNPLTVTVTP